jgi:hypothetical protein
MSLLSGIQFAIYIPQLHPESMIALLDQLGNLLFHIRIENILQVKDLNSFEK